MTPQIILVLSILGISAVLFITEFIRVDVVALTVLVILALTGLVSPTEAVSGFSNPAVITVLAVLILSSGLARTGVASMISRPLILMAGKREARLIALIMLVAGVLSGFMNNLGVTALMLPVVVDISRRTKIPPSRLVMPLAFATLLGGLNTLIGTPANILASDALRQYGFKPFHMFDYSPIGLAIMTIGILFMVLIGRHLLPNRDIKDLSERHRNEPTELFGLYERMFIIRLPQDSILSGKTIAQSRLGAALGLNVLAILRPDQNLLAPDPSTELVQGDRLLVEGQPNYLRELTQGSILVAWDDKLVVEQLISTNIDLGEIKLLPKLSFQSQTLENLDFRNRFGVIVIAIRRDSKVIRTNLEKIPLQQDDILLVQGTQEQLNSLRVNENITYSDPPDVDLYNLDERLIAMQIPEHSTLVGKNLVESRLGDAFGLGVMGISRKKDTILIPNPDEILQAGDMLLIKSRPDDLQTLNGLSTLEIDDEPLPDLDELESEYVGLSEIVLSPRTKLAGKTIRQIDFREKFGLSILAIWRQGKAYRSNLRDMVLRFGDALLIYGQREKLYLLGREPDFLVLTEQVQEPPHRKKAPIAIIIMAVVISLVIFDIIPISIATLTGVVLMILTGCLTMEEAYFSIEWKAIFLIAGMLPLGIAMEKTGVASFVANGMVNLIGHYGPIVVTTGIFILGMLASQFMPNSVVVVLLAPIAFNTASNLGISPYPLIMAVVIAASAAFMTPVGHTANLLVMGPGGYRFGDYFKVGVLLTVLILVISLILLPVMWPF
jgi:di/tricarboxylate transporter